MNDTAAADIDFTCAFTGHRPERLSMPEAEVVSWLDGRIKDAIDDGYTDFITGMQRGVDIWAAEAVLRYRDSNPNLTLVAASAFEGMEEGWSGDWKRRYERIIGAADEVYYIGNCPGRRAFFERNEWMIDNASRLIAVYNGVPGGTQKTIEYAEGLGREVVAMGR